MKNKNLFTTVIRKVNPYDPEDMRRISLIDKNSEVLKQMVGKQLNDKELSEFVTDGKKKTLYAVSGQQLVSKNEIGKIQGWILVYSGKEVTARTERALKRKFLKSKLPVLEVSYAKYPPSPPGQMACGLRQVLLEIARKDRYQRLVVAFVAPENIRSQHVLEASGFILQPQRVLWSPQESKKEDQVYILDWGKLRQKIYAAG